MKCAISLRRHPLFFAGAVAALAGLGGCGWTPWSYNSVRSTGPVYADDALADYLPAEAGAVYALNVRQTLESRAGRRLAGPLRLFLDKEKTDHPWVDGLGADPMKDVEEARFVFCPPDLDHPLVLLRGRSAVGPGRWREASDGPCSFYEFPGPQPGSPTCLAQVGDYIAVCDSRQRLLGALNYAAAPRPIVTQDARLHDLVRQVDTNQSVWLAVAFDKLGPVPRLADFGLETVLRPVLRHAESVRGAVSFGDDVRGQFVFHAHTDADAKELEQDLDASCTVAQGAYFLPGLDPSLLPLLEFMGAGTTNRDGRDITLTCRLPADRIAP